MELEEIKATILAAIAAAADETALEEVRVAALGKKGQISARLKSLGQMSAEEKKIMGPALNGLKIKISEAMTARKETLAEEALEARLATENIDITLESRQARRGKIHPVSQVYEEITTIFADMGFETRTGPDIEDDYYNFTVLNFPPDHPAREMHDTFFFPAKQDGTRKLLRTHTSPVQARTMMQERPPIRIIAPGRTYRCDSDQTHTPMFHQIEGLVIDEVTHMGHLKGTLEAFLKAFFELDDIEIRLRPHFFPFTEPSAEMDVKYHRVEGEIRVGEGESWMEILGCGMVHPAVLSNCGVDPDHYQGFAFGLGVDRLAMLKYGIPDLRDCFTADLSWLAHYGFESYDQPGAGQRGGG